MTTASPRTRCLVTAATLSLAALLGSGCTADGTTTITASETLPEASIAGSPTGGALTNPAALAADIEQTSQFQDKRAEAIKSLSITGVELAITPSSTDVTIDAIEDGNPDNFDFVTALDIYIEATINGALQSELVASIPSGDARLGAGSATLTLDVSGIDLVPYAMAPAGYTVRISATGSAPPDDVIFVTNVTYRVRLDVGGAVALSGLNGDGD